MNASRPGWFGRSTSVAVAAVAVCCMTASLTQRATADATAPAVEKIECVTPDGRLTTISFSEQPNVAAPATGTGPAAIRCHLQEGETTFIIPLPKGASVDHFTFINDNAAAAGEFNIAVANSHLPPQSREWTEVDGIVPFAHKRLFNLSMVGIDAKYLKLSFRVDRTNRVARAKPAQRIDATALAQVAPPAAGPGDE